MSEFSIIDAQKLYNQYYDKNYLEVLEELKTAISNGNEKYSIKAEKITQWSLDKFKKSNFTVKKENDFYIISGWKT